MYTRRGPFTLLSILIVWFLLFVMIAAAHVVEQYASVRQEAQAFQDLETINTILSDYKEIAPFQNMEDIYELFPNLPDTYYKSYDGVLCNDFAYLRMINQKFQIKEFPSVKAYEDIPVLTDQIRTALMHARFIDMSDEEFSYRIQLYLALHTDDMRYILELDPSAFSSTGGLP